MKKVFAMEHVFRKGKCFPNHEKRRDAECRMTGRNFMIMNIHARAVSGQIKQSNMIELHFPINAYKLPVE